MDSLSYPDFNVRLRRQLETLPHKKALRFALAINELLFPDYHAFYKKHKMGNPDLLREAMRLVAFLAPGAIDVRLLDEVMRKLTDMTPDMDDFGDWDGSYALNAAACIYHSLEYMKTGDAAALIAIATAYTDTADFKLQEKGITDGRAIEMHPLMEEARLKLLELTA